MIPVFRPSREEEESSASGKTLESGGVGSESCTWGFEEAVTGYSEPDHACGVTPATDGLSIIFKSSDANGEGEGFIIETVKVFEGE